MEIQRADKGVKEANGVFGGDVIFEAFREEQGLGAIQAGAMIHA
jgi:hypothetical protein